MTSWVRVRIQYNRCLPLAHDYVSVRAPLHYSVQLFYSPLVALLDLITSHQIHGVIEV